MNTTPEQLDIYSEQTNFWFSNVEILFVSKIMAQRIRLSLRKLVVAMPGITPSIVPSNKYLAFFVDSILTPEWGPFDQSVSLLTQFHPHLHGIIWLNLKYQSIYYSDKKLLVDWGVWRGQTLYTNSDSKNWFIKGHFCLLGAGCTAENKAKPMWNLSNKGNYPGLVCA